MRNFRYLKILLEDRNYASEPYVFLMIVSAAARHVIENASAFVVKNIFCYHALDPIRTNLQDVINRIAQPHFGILSPWIGRELGIIFAVPVTVFFGEMIALAVKETIRSIVHIAMLLFLMQHRKQCLPLCVRPQFALRAMWQAFYQKAIFVILLCRW